jgi:hypothetical protein
MPRAGRWLGRACRPGGSGSNHPGLSAGSRPWRPSWVAVRGGRPGRRRGRGERRCAGPGRCTLCLLPRRVDLRVPCNLVVNFRQEYTVNVVVPLQRVDGRGRRRSTASQSFLKPGWNIRSLRKSALRFRPRRSGNDGGIRGGPGGRSESASAHPGPPGSYPRPGPCGECAVGCTPMPGGPPSRCLRSRQSSGMSGSWAGDARRAPGRWDG